MSNDGSGQSRRLVVSKGRLIVAVASAFAMATTGTGWAGLHTAVGRIITSHVLPDVPTPSGQDQNILLMGLDSRLDQNGQPLPQEMYDALHAGDETSGGYNANVLIVVHIPGGDGPVTAVSIPRDDYVELSGCPGSVCKGKIKQAYGLAYQQALDSQANGNSDGAGATDLTAREQTAREAGRKTEIGTVQDLLGISVNHFVEVTLGAFFQIAKLVEPITVCLNEDTVDSYSGADFHQGVQQIDAAQAMAFVRQRRDENNGSFTDFDRTRRQQAFLVSLANALRRGGALSSLSALRNLLQVARDNIAVDAGLNLVDFATRASQVTDRPLSFYTLPISGFAQDTNGSDINLVDVSTLRQIVHQRFFSDTPPRRLPCRQPSNRRPHWLNPWSLTSSTPPHATDWPPRLRTRSPAVGLPEAEPPLRRPQQTTAPSNTAPVPPKARRCSPINCMCLPPRGTPCRPEPFG